MRHYIAGLALLVAPSLAHAQFGTLTGTVSSPAGVPIGGASVRIEELSIVATTRTDGAYTIVFVEGWKDRIVSVRARLAEGGPSDIHEIRVAAGPQILNFQLREGGVRDVRVSPAKAMISTKTRLDSDYKTTLRARMTTEDRARRDTFGEARPTMAAAQGGSTYRLQMVQAQADPFGRYLFTAEQVMQHQDEISLKDAQRSELQKAVEEAQSQTIKMQWALAQDTEKLSKMLSEQSLIEKDVMAQTDRIMAIEREIKRAQMTLMIKIKNTLTAEQQTKLRQLR